jgi:hypothetical protein
MDCYATRVATYVEGRKQPQSYLCTGACEVRSSPNRKPLFVPGHYEIATGGCDTLKTPGLVYDLVNEAAARGYDVIFEGIMVGDDVTRCVATSKAFPPLLVIVLNTPIEECLRGIQSRRDAKGNEKPLDPKNTVSRAERLRKSMVPRLKDAGVEVRWSTRAEGFDLARERLGLL